MPEFVSLADALRASAAAPAPPTLAPADEAERDGPAPDADADVAPHDALREARLFRARLADAFDAAAARLLRELATDVLARELRLAPCDLRALVARLIAGAPALRLRVAADDADGDYDLPVVVDEALAAGDAIVELDGGALDARLGVRLAVVLEAST